jgi:hypothetical protein
MYLEITEAGTPNFILPDQHSFRGDGTERFGYGQQQGGARPYINFYPRSVQMNAASLEAGRPIFKSQVFIKIMQPGERDMIDRQATRQDAERYPAEYSAYCRGREAVPDGIPLAVLFPHHGDIVQALEFHRVRTVEQLAALNDTQKQNLGHGGYEWQLKAQRYLEALEKGQGFASLEAKLEKYGNQLNRQLEINGLQQQKIQELEARLSAALTGSSTLGLPPAAAAVPYVPQRPVGAFVPVAPGELGADDDVQQALAPSPLDSAPDAFHEDHVAAAAAQTETAPRRNRRN